MYRITYVVEALRGPRTPLADEAMRTMLGALLVLDMDYLRAYPATPNAEDALTSGAVKLRDPIKGIEDWLDIPTMLRMGVADRRSFACWVAAEARVRRGSKSAFPTSPTWPTSSRITFCIDLFKGAEEQELSHRALQTLLLGLMKIDEQWLKASPSTPLVYDAGVRYEEEPVGQEDWQDAATTIRMGIGDCVPVDTLVLREDYSFARIVDLEPGDKIIGDGEVTEVLESCVTGEKDILEFDLDNRCTLRVSPEHRVFLADGSEVRAKDLVVGQDLHSPSKLFPDDMAADEKAGITMALVSALPKPWRRRLVRGLPRIMAIRQGERALCADITTSSGRFYLPETDVVVHNCEDLACWRAAELRVRFGVQATPTFTYKVRANGSYLYHITVRLPDGRIEDPSRRLGMR